MNLLSLRSRCLLAVRDYVESGQLTDDVYLLPPDLRQDIIGLILLHGTIDRSECVATLASERMLADFRLLDLAIGTGRNDRFVQRLAVAIGSTPIADLRLSVRLPDSSFASNPHAVATYLNDWRTVLDACDQLTSVHVQYDELPMTSTTTATGAYLPPVIAGRRSLRDASISGLKSSSKLLELHRGLGACQNLCRLQLSDLRVTKGEWHRFLTSVRKSLRTLSLSSIVVDGVTNYNILPVPLRALTHLSLYKCRTFNASWPFTQNLLGCAQLEQLTLDITNKHRLVDLECISKMTALRSVWLKLCHPVREDVAHRILTLFGDRITSLESYYIWRAPFTPEPLNCSRLLQSCHRLSVLSLRVYSESAHLVAEFLQSVGKATALIELRLVGELSAPLLDALFANCRQLRTLKLTQRDEAPLHDAHVRGWLDNGARPAIVQLNGQAIRLAETTALHLLMVCAERLQLLTIESPCVAGWPHFELNGYTNNGCVASFGNPHFSPNLSPDELDKSSDGLPEVNNNNNNNNNSSSNNNNNNSNDHDVSQCDQLCLLATAENRRSLPTICALISRPSLRRGDFRKRIFNCYQKATRCIYFLLAICFLVGFWSFLVWKGFAFSS